MVLETTGTVVICYQMKRNVVRVPLIWSVTIVV